MILRAERARLTSAGFTLIEMIIVLVVLGLVAGIVVSRGPSHSANVDVRSAATRLVQGLRAARAQAITDDSPQPFSIAADQHSFRVGVGLPQILPRGIDAHIEVGGNVSRAITFLPDGSSGGGVVVLVGPAHKMVITVDWLSGHVHVGELLP